MQKRKSEQTSAPCFQIRNLFKPARILEEKESATSPMRHIQKFRTADLETWLPKLIADIKKNWKIFYPQVGGPIYWRPYESFWPSWIRIRPYADPNPIDQNKRRCGFGSTTLFLFYLANCLRLLGISVSMGCVILTSGYWSPPLPTRDFTSVSGFLISNYSSGLVFIVPAINLTGFYERYVVLRHPRSMTVLPSGNLQKNYDYCITIKCFIYLFS